MSDTLQGDARKAARFAFDNRRTFGRWSFLYIEHHRRARADLLLALCYFLAALLLLKGGVL